MLYSISRAKKVNDDLLSASFGVLVFVDNKILVLFIEITSDRKEKNKKANRQYLEMNIERAFCQFKK